MQGWGKRAAVYNYVGAVVNTRGKRDSNDPNHPFEDEAQDLYEVIDWVSKQPWSNGKSRNDRRKLFRIQPMGSCKNCTRL